MIVTFFFENLFDTILIDKNIWHDFYQYALNNKTPLLIRNEGCGELMNEFFVYFRDLVVEIDKPIKNKTDSLLIEMVDNIAKTYMAEHKINIPFYSRIN